MSQFYAPSPARLQTALVFLIGSLVLLAAPQASFAQCTQTLSVGDNVAEAVAAAENGSTICLGDGAYGSVDFTNITKASHVTVKSLNARNASITPRVINSHFLRFQSLTLGRTQVQQCSKAFEFIDNVFTAAFSLTNRDSTCTNYPLNWVIEGNAFGDIGPGISEGRLDVRDRETGTPNGSMNGVIRHNTFGPGCKSDGIQFTGRVDGVTIGPGNIFDGIVQSGSVHCDMIQFYSGGSGNVITGNWFKNGSVVLTHHTGTPNGTVFSHNLITDVSQIQIATTTDFVFEHNTIFNLGGFGAPAFVVQSKNGIMRSNILAGVNVAPNITGTTRSYDLCTTSTHCSSGTNNISGTPVFIGGSTPSSWQEWQLIAESPGKGNAHDGADRGTLYYGAAANDPPSPPTNLRIVP